MPDGNPDQGGEATSANDDEAVELSVVIPAFNAAATIGDQLDALLAQDWSASWEVIVADNGSTDDTAHVVRTMATTHPRLRVVDAGGRPGPSYARNCGVRAANGSSIAFCDADDVVADGWLAAIGGALREHRLVTGPQEYERLNPSWTWGVYGTRPARALQTFDDIFPFGPTANLGVRRDHFDDVGGFDAAMNTAEDLDFCLRSWLTGVSVVFVPDAVVHYRYRCDVRSLWRQALSYGATTPVIARKLAEHDQATPSRWAGAKRWIWLIRRLPTLRDRAGRARWVVVAGNAVGRVIGSARARWFML